MMLRVYSNFFFLLLCVLISSCKSFYPTQFSSAVVKVNKTYTPDSSILAFYHPYKDSIDKIVSIPIVVLETDLTKQLPESSLGNFMVDILRVKATEYTGDTIDVAILNYGGIRIPSLSKGMLTIQDAYLLMPFENYIVEQVLTGQQISDFCDSIAMKKGWPISGMSFRIKNGEAIDIKINNEPLEISRKYKVALNDYIANGGDGMTFLKAIPQKQTGVLFREAIIQYWKDQALLHLGVTAKTENRISYAE